MKYQALHTCDELGGRYPSAIVDYTGDDLGEAIRIADERTVDGQCGFVRREDGCILAPNGSWITCNT